MKDELIVRTKQFRSIVLISPEGPRWDWRRKPDEREYLLRNPRGDLKPLPFLNTKDKSFEFLFIAPAGASDKWVGVQVAGEDYVALAFTPEKVIAANRFREGPGSFEWNNKTQTLVFHSQAGSTKDVLPLEKLYDGG